MCFVEFEAESSSKLEIVETRAQPDISTTLRRLSYGTIQGPLLRLSIAGANQLARSAYTSTESRRILKNLLILGFSFTLLFTAFMAMANLQSSINSEGGIGMDALAGLYFAFLLSSLFLPSIVLAHLKTKWTLILSISGYTLYQVAQFYPRIETLLSTGIFEGICAGQLWAAQGVYLTLLAEEYAYLKSEKFEIVLQKFFGVFFLFSHSSQIWGNLISSFVLSSSGGDEALESANLSGDSCGISFESVALDESIKNQLQVPESWKVNMLTGIFVGCSVAAALVILVFVDSLERYGENERALIGKWNDLLIATVKHWRIPSQVLIIPLSIWLGVQESFLASEFTGAYIACAWGVQNIGFVMMAFGVFASVSSLLIGRIIEYVGRPLVFMAAFGLNLASLITLFYWKPNQNQSYVFFLISAAWGISDGVWSPQIKALYGSIFPKSREAAFSNAGLWWSLGFMIVYILENRLNTILKLCIYTGLLILGIFGYVAVEIIERSKLKKDKKPDTKL